MGLPWPLGLCKVYNQGFDFLTTCFYFFHPGRRAFLLASCFSRMQFHWDISILTPPYVGLKDSFSIAAWDVKIKRVIETSKHSPEHDSICSCRYCPSFQFLHLKFKPLMPAPAPTTFLLSAVHTSIFFFYFCFLNVYRRKSPCYLDLPSFYSPISLFF